MITSYKIIEENKNVKFYFDDDEWESWKKNKSVLHIEVKKKYFIL